METKFLEYAKRLQAIAQAGLTYALNDYDLERYAELKEISLQMMSDLSNTKLEVIEDLFKNETGYQTPKVDVRAVVFRDQKILMVKEKIDGHWSLPGGWADVGYTPNEIAIKEAREESGLEVKPKKLVAVLDKKCHPHPPSPYHTYKIFILCEEVGGILGGGMETSEVDFFELNELPPLSEERITRSQIELMYAYHNDPTKIAITD
ncbi:MAG TPA: NUDIX hydrolase [Cytophagaceae bacterium]|jgi:ADP-ribose pyrophosphatase YjhB (NUDIX family)